MPIAAASPPSGVKHALAFSSERLRLRGWEAHGEQHLEAGRGEQWQAVVVLPPPTPAERHQFTVGRGAFPWVALAAAIARAAGGVWATYEGGSLREQMAAYLECVQDEGVAHAW